MNEAFLLRKFCLTTVSRECRALEAITPNVVLALGRAFDIVFCPSRHRPMAILVLTDARQNMPPVQGRLFLSFILLERVLSEAITI
jgi:hypothetical protein